MSVTKPAYVSILTALFMDDGCSEPVEISFEHGGDCVLGGVSAARLSPSFNL